MIGRMTDMLDSPWKIVIVPVVIIVALVVLVFMRMFGRGSR
jgi:hypothetical protein